MVKPTGNGMVLTARDTEIIRDVAALQVASRAQLERLGHFGSKTRGNAVLLRLVRHHYLDRRYQPTTVGTRRPLYLPGPGSAEALGDVAVLATRRRIRNLSDLFLTHQLLLNDVRLAFRACPDLSAVRWFTDAELRAVNLPLVPDGYVDYLEKGEVFGAFVELDRGTETLGRFTRKVQAYLEVARSGAHLTLATPEKFRVLVLTESKTRLNNLRRATARLTDRMFWFATLPSLATNGPLAAIWQRPVGSELHSLTER